MNDDIRKMIEILKTFDYSQVDDESKYILIKMIADKKQEYEEYIKQLDEMIKQILKYIDKN